MKPIDVTDLVAHAEKVFGSCITNRYLRRRDMLAAVNRGFVKSIGLVEQCDDDGFHLPNRKQMEGFRVTAKGRKALTKYHAAASPG